MKHPHPTRAALASCLLLFAACSDAPHDGPGSDAAGEVAAERPAEPPPAPRRVRLFDLIEQAEWTGVDDQSADVAPPAAHRYDFDAATPAAWWSGTTRNRGRSIDYVDGLPETATVAAEGGLSGGALTLGPAWPDRSRVMFLVPAPPLAQVTVRGRVRLTGNPLAGEASSREVCRIYEHTDAVESPIANRRSRQRSSQRVSRQLDPGGWDRFETSFLTGSGTGALEVQLLHRSGEADEAVTRFDDVEVLVEPLSQAALYARLEKNYVPRDGRAELTPWRLRVELGSDGRGVVRDAVFLPPPASVAFPVQLPDAEVAPLLRFHYAMAPEAHRADGDGARIEVRFAPEDGQPVAIGAVEFDPKNERDHRGWLEARMDLTPVAGLTGRLVFSTSDAPDTEPDDLDAVLLSSPRIEPADEAPGAFNVLLIGVDTLRADRMSFFGYERDTTPNLARVADAGVRFPSTRSQAPWTLPSFSSILTSLYPSSHGAGRGGHDEWTGIDPTTTALPEILARFGYETVGIVANGLIAPQYGLDQGFDSYASRWGFETGKQDAVDVAEFIDAHRSTPWLMFWHILDPHLPYATERETREAFCDADYAGQFSKGSRGGGPQVPFGALDPRPGRRWYVHEGPPPPPDITEEDARFISDYYDAEIFETDAAIGIVLDALEASGQWERTIIAFVADHGEGLGDHDHYHHGYTLFDDQVHIPMLLRIPGQAEGTTIARPVASIDLAPTILGALGIEPPEFFQGVDRLAADAPSGDAYFVEYPTYDSSAQKAWVEGRFKYLHDPVFHTEALYDLEADPGELTDVAAQHPEVVARARAELDAFRWAELQKGRYHLRVAGAPGQKLRLHVKTDDLFDANFVCRPQPPEEHFTLDLERQNLVLETELDKDRLEFVFWGRGGRLDIEATLDGEPLTVELGGDDERHSLPKALSPGSIPVAQRDDMPWPDRGVMRLWLEAGASTALPVLPTPEEIEALQAMGYAH